MGDGKLRFVGRALAMPLNPGLYTKAQAGGSGADDLMTKIGEELAHCAEGRCSEVTTLRRIQAMIAAIGAQPG